MPQRLLAVLMFLVAFLSCRDGPAALVGPARESLILPPDVVVSQQAIQKVTSILEDPFVHELVQNVDDRGTVSRLRNSVLNVSGTATDDQRLALHNAFITAQMEMT
ncbi:MAG: hypothetical protein GTN62_03400, partial [Gemmatimonadales bacterium]|nr:hypothetical protein [Gemmatimonadales bacterium]NIN10349.1 hypothetical protein [Gemmatimonadales bacterium]NIN49144.1 hypothetical protein [Gemmatimonadales bacterium]NIP06608.1 hypothetical protein [Gemmatimonadales bacterium]NIS65430.1 hypothetical protein [Gemmatimonadales bacterium]